MADRTEILRQFRERNYNAAKGKPAPQAKPVQMEDIKKIAAIQPEPKAEKKRWPEGVNPWTNDLPQEKKKRGPYKKKEKPAAVAPKKTGKRGPYKPRKPKA
jgi:hypothetical protein